MMLRDGEYAWNLQLRRNLMDHELQETGELFGWLVSMQLNDKKDSTVWGTADRKTFAVTVCYKTLHHQLQLQPKARI